MPKVGNSSSHSETEFSTERALIPLREIAKAPHYHGSQDHIRVRAFLVNELKDLGFDTEIQEGYVLNPEERNIKSLG